MTRLLEARQIQKSYSGHTALNNVNLSVTAGSIHGLLGPNGAGKTSLIRILMQILLPDAGEVFFKNQPLCREHLRFMGYLPEERGLYKKMTVWDQILYFGRLRGLSRTEARRRALAWLDKLELGRWRHRKAQDLSKGMQQKVQFIIAVLHEPEFIIMDEPFSGFDPLNAALIRDEILAMKKQGCTVVLSTHNMNSVEELCDEITLIHKSQVVLAGPVRDIRKAHNSGEYLLRFRGHHVQFTTALWTTAEITEKLEDPECTALRLRPLTPGGINAVLQAVLPVCEIVEVREYLPSMNQIFLQAVAPQSQKSNDTKNLTE
ncbi:MAG: ATP-binding cassette domain-containing protein [Flavobacteriales bacterium]|nr:ATP-binding cassette domain-containing protein [Flavobacteriales bacterium]